MADINLSGQEKIGLILVAVNNIERTLQTYINRFFLDYHQPNSPTGPLEVIKPIILSRVLNDENVFPTLETKRMLVLRIVQIVSNYNRQTSNTFDTDKWTGLLKSVSVAQEVRNFLAHNNVKISDGRHAEFLEFPKTNIFGDDGFKERCIDLDEELQKISGLSKKLDEEIDSFLKETEAALSA